MVVPLTRVDGRWLCAVEGVNYFGHFLFFALFFEGWRIMRVTVFFFFFLCA
jgi:hypothetical protein